MDYTPISIQQLPQKTTSQIDTSSALVMISEIDTSDILSSYTVPYIDIVNSIEGGENKITDQLATVYFPSSFVLNGIDNPMDALDQTTGNITNVSLFDAVRVEAVGIPITDVTNFNIYLANVPPINNTFETTIVNLTPPTLGADADVYLNRATKVNITFIQDPANLTIPLWKAFQIFLGNKRIDLIDATYAVLGNLFTLEIMVNGLSPEDEIATGGAASFMYINNVDRKLANIATNLQNQIDNIGPGGEVTYANVLAVFAPNANNTNIDFGVYVDPMTMLNRITLNFNTTQIYESIKNAVTTANNYTDQQIALIVNPIEPNILPTINIPNPGLISNNPTNAWTNLAAYEGHGAYQLLAPTNNYILNYTFDNGKITGNAGNTGVIVPALTTENINDYMMCPITLNNASLTSSYIFVTINITITNRYTGANTVGNQAFNVYLNTARLDYLNDIQPGSGIAIPYFHSEFSPAPFIVGNSWTITRTFAVNSLAAVEVNNPVVITFPYNGMNFVGGSGGTTPFPQGNWEDVTLYATGLVSPYNQFFLSAYEQSITWAYQNSKFYAALPSFSNPRIVIDYDWVASSAPILSVGSNVAVKYNTCYLFLNKSALTDQYIPVNITVNYRMKVMWTGNSNKDKFFRIYLGIFLLDDDILPTSAPPIADTRTKEMANIFNFTANVLAVKTGTFEIIVYVNKDTFTFENPNNRILFSELGDVNDPDPENNSVVLFDETTNSYTSQPLENLLGTTYGEADFLAENPSFVPGIGPFFEYLVLDNRNYSVVLPFVYYNVAPDVLTGGISGSLTLDLKKLKITTKLSLVIDNTSNSEQISINIVSLIFIAGTTNPLTTGTELEVNKYYLTIPSYSIGTFDFSCTQASLDKIGETFDTLPPVTVKGYLEKYTNDINKQWLNTGFYCGYFASPKLYFPAELQQPWNNYTFSQYFNIYDTPNFLFGGDYRCAYSFLPSHPGREEFWKSPTYSMSFSPITDMENRIKTANFNNVIPSQNLYPRLARVRMKLPTPDIISILDNTENPWEKEFGRLRDVLLNDPTNFFDYVDCFEIFGWDGLGNNVYLSVQDGVTTYDTTTPYLLDMNNVFSFVQNLSSYVAPNTSSFLPGFADLPTSVPYYEFMPKQLNQQRWQLTSDPFAGLDNSYETLIDIDRPPLFFQGLFALTFDNYTTFDNLLTMSFTSFNDTTEFSNESFTYPTDLFVSNYNNRYEFSGSTFVFDLLTSNTNPPIIPPIPPYFFPTRVNPIPYSGFTNSIN